MNLNLVAIAGVPPSPDGGLISCTGEGIGVVEGPFAGTSAGQKFLFFGSFTTGFLVGFFFARRNVR